MSPVSRGRKGKQNKRSIRRAALPELFTEPGECDCPACSDADFDLPRLIDQIVASAADLVETEDPLDAEVVGAAFVSIGTLAGEQLLVSGLIPELEVRSSSQALVVPATPGQAGLVGLDHATGFDPNQFDADAVTQALSRLASQMA